jgi:uncharacterized protein (DUF488 family)
VALLERAGVGELVDVRTVPGSRRNPQFGRAALCAGLAAAGIGYRHEAALGGFRRPRPGSPNTGWVTDAFRGYADYMASPEFGAALERLEAVAANTPPAVMCAEAQWWRCHRRLIADALHARGWRVLHLGVREHPVEHKLTPFAVVDPGGVLRYPRSQGELPAER